MADPTASGATVFMVTEYVDIETHNPHGVFSRVELAREYIERQVPCPSWDASKTMCRDRSADFGTPCWSIDQYTVDSLVPRGKRGSSRG